MTVSELPVSSINSMRTQWLSILGIGEDGAGGLSPAAREILEQAALVVGGRRHLDLCRPLIRCETMSWPTPIEDAFPRILERRGEPIAVLASGDPFHFGIGKQLASLVGMEEILCLPQPSAFSLAAARLGWAQQDLATVSLHGRALERIIPLLQPEARILALSWDGTTPAKLAALLTERKFGKSRLTVLERLGNAQERIRTVTAEAFDLGEIDPLNTIALEVEAEPDAPIIGLAAGLEDRFYENDGQLSKRAVRAVVLSSLNPRQGELLWDIGLGAGSVAIEWLLRHPSLRAIGVEEQPERAERAARNAAALGVPQLKIVKGRAPEALKDLERPNAMFIGGGLTDEVLDTAWDALLPGGRLVANAVTLEGEQRLIAAYQRLGGELLRLDIARAEPVGGMQGWRSAMPVTHWRVEKS